MPSEKGISDLLSGKRTESGFIGDNVSLFERNAAREAMRSFMNVQERAKAMTRAMLEITLDGH